MAATPPNWPDAACRDAPLDLFITLGDEDDEPAYPPVAAVVFCNSCRYRVECLAWAVENDEVGVWGGTSSYQRRQLTRERDRVRCPGCGAADLIYEHTIELCLSCGMSWRII
jgi:hypothetical protein